MAAQYELLKELLNSGTKLSFGQEFFYKFYQAFILKDRWVQYVQGVGTTLLVTLSPPFSLSSLNSPSAVHSFLLNVYWLSEAEGLTIQSLHSLSSDFSSK